MRRCLCGVVPAPGFTHCHFCRKTIRLIRAGRCVTCIAPVIPEYEERVEGRCRACRDRRVTMCRPTRRLLVQASKARYRARAAA